jgi:hypothetical protein
MTNFSTRVAIATMATILTGAPALAAPPVRVIADFRQAPPAKGALPKVAYYKNEDVLKTTTTVTKTPIYTTVTTPIVKKGVIVGYNTTQKITGYNTVTTKATNITPKAELYTTNGSSTTASAAAAKFTFLWPITQPYTASLNGEQNALMTLHAISTTAPVALADNHFAQVFDSGTLSFTRTVPVKHVGAHGAYGPDLSNLLTVTFTNAVLTGGFGGTAAALTASTPSSHIIFTSDFMKFDAGNTPTDFSFSIAETSATPALTRALVDPTLTNVTGSRSLVSFRGNPIGQFSSNGVPEPANWALMIGGFALIGAAARRRSSRITVLQH